MLHILLLVPKMNGPGCNKRWNSDWPPQVEESISASMWNVFTPGVLTLSSLCDSSTHAVDVVDEEFCQIDTNAHYDIVAMYLITPNAKRGYMLSELFRRHGAYIVFGGVHTLVCEQEAASCADTVLLGEAEQIWPEFLEDYEHARPKKRYVQNTGTLDISTSPIPDFQKLPENARRIIPVQTSRGCPHGCRFCNVKNVYGLEYRCKPYKQVEQEVQSALSVNRRAVIYFTDDNFMCRQERAVILLEQLMEQRFKWYANTDISLGDNEKLLRLAYKSGCRQVLIGFESLNESNLDGIDADNFKSKRVNQYKESIKRIQGNGIGIIGSFIVGLEMDDTDNFDRIYEFANQTGLYGVSVTACTPYPGTALFEQAKADGKVLTCDWDKYTIFEPVLTPGKMTVGELRKGYSDLISRLHSAQSLNTRLEVFKEQMRVNKGGKK